MFSAGVCRFLLHFGSQRRVQIQEGNGIEPVEQQPSSIPMYCYHSQTSTIFNLCARYLCFVPLMVGLCCLAYVAEWRMFPHWTPEQYVSAPRPLTLRRTDDGQRNGAMGSLGGRGWGTREGAVDRDVGTGRGTTQGVAARGGVQTDAGVSAEFVDC